MEQDDVQFYKRREVAALRLAKDAQSSGIEAIHREMARRYHELANLTDLSPAPRPILKVSPKIE